MVRKPACWERRHTSQTSKSDARRVGARLAIGEVRAYDRGQVTFGPFVRNV